MNEKKINIFYHVEIHPCKARGVTILISRCVIYVLHALLAFFLGSLEAWSKRELIKEYESHIRVITNSKNNIFLTHSLNARIIAGRYTSDFNWLTFGNKWK
jgi:hypothetical protein